MNLRNVKLLILIVGGIWTGAEARAGWPDWGCTPLSRWTGYGFGDGYHEGCCRTTCGHQTATSHGAGDVLWSSPTPDMYSWRLPVPNRPNASWPAAARVAAPRLPSPAAQPNIPYYGTARMPSRIAAPLQ